MPTIAPPFRYRFDPNAPQLFSQPGLTPPDAFNPNAFQNSYVPPSMDAPPPPPIPQAPQMLAPQGPQGPKMPPPGTPPQGPPPPADTAPNMELPPVDVPAPNIPNEIPKPPVGRVGGPAPASGKSPADQRLADAAANLDKAYQSRPEDPKSNALQRIGLAALAATKLAPISNLLIHPKWSEQQAAYQRNVADAAGQLKNAETGLNAESLAAQRDANAASKVESNSVAAVNQQRLAANDAENHRLAQEKIDQTQSEQLRKNLQLRLNGRDFGYGTQQDVKPGWEFIPNPEDPGRGYIAEPSFYQEDGSTSKFTGVPAGGTLTPAQRKAGVAAMNTEKLATTKHDADNVTPEDAAAYNSRITDIAKQHHVDPNVVRAGMTKAQAQEAIDGFYKTIGVQQKDREISASESKSNDTSLNPRYNAVHNDWSKQWSQNNDALDKIDRALYEMGSGAVGQAIGTITALSGLAGGTGSGLRITKAELDSLANAKSVGDTWDSLIAKYQGKQLNPQQVQQFSDILSSVKTLAEQKRNLYDVALQKLAAAKTPQEIAAVEAEMRGQRAGISQSGTAKPKTYTQSDVAAAIAAHPGLTAQDAESAFKSKGWVKK